MQEITSPIDIIMYIMRTIIFVAAALLIISMFFSFNALVKSGDTERAAFEIADDLSKSELTVDRWIFDAAKLDSIQNIEEQQIPFRNCKYVYNARFEVQEGAEWRERWKFGYGATEAVAPGDILEGETVSTQNYIIGIYENGVIRQGVMIITVYDTHIGTLSCMIENAWLHHENKTAVFPCLHFGSFPWQCVFAEKAGDFLCYAGTVNCREMRGINFTITTVEYNEGDVWSAYYDNSSQQVIVRAQK